MAKFVFHSISLIVLSSFITHVSSQAWAAGSGGGGGGSFPTTQSQAKTPKQLAAQYYKAGLRQKNKAWKLEEKAAKAKKPQKREKLLAKANKAYAKAQTEHGKVLQVAADHHEAANELGYALRKLGDYKKAIGAYNYALKLKPDFLEAIEYRGEAYLALGFYDETKEAYLRLFRENPDLAAQLMQAINHWLEGKSEFSEAEQAFADWAVERKALVGFSLSPATQPNW